MSVYETTRPTCLCITKNSKQLEEWRDCELPSFRPNSRLLRLPIGVKFKVVKFGVVEEYDIVEVLNDVWCDELIEYVSSDDGKWSKIITHNIALSITGNVKMYVGDLEANAIKMIL